MLETWQALLFQKRRVLRRVDKGLDHEINRGRLREFRAELDDSLDRKRVTVMHNQRSISSKSDRAQRLQGIQALSIEDLVNCEMFFRQNSADVAAIAKTLISKGGPDAIGRAHV